MILAFVHDKIVWHTRVECLLIISRLNLIIISQRCPRSIFKNRLFIPTLAFHQIIRIVALHRYFYSNKTAHVFTKRFYNSLYVDSFYWMTALLLFCKNVGSFLECNLRKLLLQSSVVVGMLSRQSILTNRGGIKKLFGVSFSYLKLEIIYRFFCRGIWRTRFYCILFLTSFERRFCLNRWLIAKAFLFEIFRTSFVKRKSISLCDTSRFLRHNNNLKHHWQKTFIFIGFWNTLCKT